MMYNKKRLEVMEKEVFKNNLSFYNCGLNLKELRELLCHYEKVKNKKFSILRMADDVITMTQVGLLTGLGFLPLFVFALIFDNVKETNIGLYLFSTYIISIVLFFSFEIRKITKKSIINFFDAKIGSDDSIILLSHMKSKIAFIEKKKVINSVKHADDKKTNIEIYEKPLMHNKRRL